MDEKSFIVFVGAFCAAAFSRLCDTGLSKSAPILILADAEGNTLSKQLFLNFVTPTARIRGIVTKSGNSLLLRTGSSEITPLP